MPEFELLSAGFAIGIIAPYGLSGALQSFPKKEIKDRHSLWIAPVRSLTVVCSALTTIPLSLFVVSLHSFPYTYCSASSYPGCITVALCILQERIIPPHSHILLVLFMLFHTSTIYILLSLCLSPWCWSCQTKSPCVCLCLFKLIPVEGISGLIDWSIDRQFYCFSNELIIYVIFQSKIQSMP